MYVCGVCNCVGVCMGFVFSKTMFSTMPANSNLNFLTNFSAIVGECEFGCIFSNMCVFVYLCVVGVMEEIKNEEEKRKYYYSL